MAQLCQKVMCNRLYQTRKKRNAWNSTKKCNILKLEIFIETVIEWGSEHVVANLYLRPYMQMVLTFQIHPGTIKLIQSDNIAEANIAGKENLFANHYLEPRPSNTVDIFFLVATDVYSQFFKQSISCNKLIF